MPNFIIVGYVQQIFGWGAFLPPPPIREQPPKKPILNRVNILFEFSIYLVIFLHLKNLFSHCSSTFFPFYKLELCSYIGKFWFIYIIGIKMNKKTRLFQSPLPLIIFHWIIEFSNPLFIKTPVFILDLSVKMFGQYDQ